MTPSILWLGRTIPLPLNTGDRVYSAHLAGALARAGARVTYLGHRHPDDDECDLSQLEPSVSWLTVSGRPRSKLFSVFSARPNVGARFFTRAYAREFSAELRRRPYDAVVLDQYGLSWALTRSNGGLNGRPLVVHIAHNFETDVSAQIAKEFTGGTIRRLLLKQNASKTRTEERLLALGSDLIVALTENDRSAFAAINPSPQIIVLPPGYSARKLGARTLTTVTPRRVIIVGSFAWTAKQMNLRRFLDAAHEAFARERIELRVVGSISDSMVSECKSKYQNVSFAGFVSDLGAELRQARIALVPELTGGGFKLKTLDYIFGRVPVAAIGSALEGVPTNVKSQFILADDLETLSWRIVEAIDDLDRLNSIQNRAFALAKGLFDWDLNGRRFLEAVVGGIEVLKSGPSRSHSTAP